MPASDDENNAMKIHEDRDVVVYESEEAPSVDCSLVEMNLHDKHLGEECYDSDHSDHYSHYERGGLCLEPIGAKAGLDAYMLKDPYDNQERSVVKCNTPDGTACPDTPLTDEEKKDITFQPFQLDEELLQRIKLDKSKEWVQYYPSPSYESGWTSFIPGGKGQNGIPEGIIPHWWKMTQYENWEDAIYNSEDGLTTNIRARVDMKAKMHEVLKAHPQDVNDKDFKTRGAQFIKDFVPRDAKPPRGYLQIFFLRSTNTILKNIKTNWPGKKDFKIGDSKFVGPTLNTWSGSRDYYIVNSPSEAWRQFLGFQGSQLMKVSENAVDKPQTIEELLSSVDTKTYMHKSYEAAKKSLSDLVGSNVGEEALQLYSTGRLNSVFQFEEFNDAFSEEHAKIVDYMAIANKATPTPGTYAFSVREKLWGSGDDSDTD